MTRNAEIWGGLFWLAIGAFVAWHGHDMGLGELNEPGSGFAFFWIGILMIALSAITIVQGVATGGVDIATFWSNTRWGRIILLVAVLIVYGSLFETIGFIPLSLALLLFLMLFVDPVKWWVAVPVAVVTTIGIWYVMTRMLLIQLPAGILAPWIQ